MKTLKIHQRDFYKVHDCIGVPENIVEDARVLLNEALEFHPWDKCTNRYGYMLSIYTWVFLKKGNCSIRYETMLKDRKKKI